MKKEDEKKEEVNIPMTTMLKARFHANVKVRDTI